MTSEAEDVRWQQRFLHDGLIFPVPVLTAEETRSYREACDHLEEVLGGRPRTVEVRQMHLHFPWAYTLATHPCIVDAVARLLGEDLIIWATELFAKHPHDAAVSIGWHRDRDYMGFDAREAVTAWVALSPCDEANGCVLAMPGPARDEAEADVASATRIRLRAGEMSMHDSRILHGSGVNTSAEKRVGFAIRFVTAAARPRHGRPQAVVARGRDRYDYFECMAPPSDTSEAEALSGLRRSAVAHLEAILQNLGDRPAARSGHAWRESDRTTHARGSLSAVHAGDRPSEPRS